MVRISVAAAAYNGEKYIGEQLDSILRQLGPQDEVVVSDDGSTDRTLELLAAYEKADRRVRVVNGPGLGIKQNIAYAIAQTKGNYIFLSDQDDVWKENKVARVMETFQKERCSLVVHDCIVVKEDLQTVIYPSFFAYRGSGAGIWSNIWKNKYIGCCMAFTGDLKKYILPIPDDIQMHDQWIGVLNDKHNRGKTVFLKEPLLYYRRHTGNVSDFGKNTVPVMIKNRLLFLRRLRGR